MFVQLKKRPKNPIIIEGFPGFGLIGTISTEFLIEHLGAEPIGKIFSRALLPLVAIRGSKVLQPLELYYAPKKNIVILHALSGASGLEWEISETLVRLAKELNAKEIISIEGIGAQTINAKAYYFTNLKEKKKEFEKIGIEELGEGVVVGVTGALLLNTDEVPHTCIFAETHSQLPDSKAAAKIIEVLDKYLGLNVDYKPLLKAAEQFEQKIKGIIEKGREATKFKEEKKPAYFG